MDTLTGDLLGLISEQLDAPTSALLGISSGIEVFMNGYEDFDYKKNIKWLVYAIKKQNNIVMNYLSETGQYKTLDFVYEFYGAVYTKGLLFHMTNLNKRILPPADEPFQAYELELFIEQTIKDHWLDGTAHFYNVLNIKHSYFLPEVRASITLYAYKYGYLDVLQLIDHVPPESKLVGMIMSEVDYGDQLLSEVYDCIGNRQRRKSSLRILRKVLGVNKDLTFFLKRFGNPRAWSIYDQIIGLIRYISKDDFNHYTMVLCFIRAIQHSNIIVANALYCAYDTLYLEELSKAESKDVEEYRKIKDRMLSLSVIYNVPFIYEEYLGKEQNPIQAFYQLLTASEQNEFVEEMLEHANYRIFNV